MAKGETLTNALIGAVVTIVFSFSGLSPLLGGGIAGYLQEESPARGARVGAISGGLAAIPFLLLVLGGLVLFFGILAGGVGLPGGVELVVILVLVLPLVAAWNIGLGAIGGYVGAYIREDAA